jgi:hypothetical protein
MRARTSSLIFVLTVAVLPACVLDGDRHQYLGDELPGDGAPPRGHCAQYSDCAACTAALGCGWCAFPGGGRCASHPDVCADNASFSWNWEPSACLAGGASDGGAPVSDDASAAAAWAKSEADDVAAGPGITKLVALTFSAPSPGTVSVSATGTCKIVTALPVSAMIAASIEPSPTAITQGADAGGFLVPGGTTDVWYPIAVTRTLPAASGANTVYLDLASPATGGSFLCSASLSALFVERPVP